MKFLVLALITVLLGNGVAGQKPPPPENPNLRHAYDRIWLWYAYQIDLENAPDDRKVGVGCIQFATIDCPPTYRKNGKGPELPNRGHCTAKLSFGEQPRPCNFYELMGWIDNKTWMPRHELLPGGIDKQKELTFDLKETAEYLEKTKRLSKKLRPFRVFDGMNLDYNEMLVKVAEHTRNTVEGFTAEQKNRQKHNYDQVKAAVTGAAIERDIDSYRWIKDMADERKMDITPKENSGFSGDSMDWVATAEMDKYKEKPKDLQDFRDAFYATDEGKKHEDVSNTFREIEALNDQVSCNT